MSAKDEALEAIKRYQRMGLDDALIGPVLAMLYEKVDYIQELKKPRRPKKPAPRSEEAHV